MMKTYAPWSEAQVAALNAYQASGRLHPFTCPYEHGAGHSVLVARNDGWHCPGCDYTQNWAHEWMTDGEPEPMVSKAAQSFRERILRQYQANIDLLSGVVDLSIHPTKQVCAVLHTDDEGNPVPCPDAAPEGLSSPPAGSRREQLPDRILALLPPGMYFSTACQTASDLLQASADHPGRAEELKAWERRMHLRCRLNHKFTGVLCECHCHEEGEVLQGVVLPQSLE